MGYSFSGDGCESVTLLESCLIPVCKKESTRPFERTNLLNIDAKTREKSDGITVNI